MSSRFSNRHGYSPPDAEITVRHDAPGELRSVIVEVAYESGFTPKPLRLLVCRILRARPNIESNWSDFPNVDGEIRRLIDDCDWYHVYDIIEEIYSALSAGGMIAGGHGGSVSGADHFSEEINRYFRGRGIGWRLVDGQIEVRGSEAFEEAIHQAKEVLDARGRKTATSELHEAIHDLSRRPEPDITGAIQHAMAALECVSRDVAGDQNPTLGELIRRYPSLFPKPLDQAIDKAWGYTSESGRHLKEGNVPTFEDAELIVGLAGVLCRYLAKKLHV